MAAAPDLMNLLSLDPSLSQSPFGGNQRFILIEKDYTNSGDFVFNSLLQHFGRREPNTQVLLVTLSHNWIHYSVSAAKCGFNLRKKQNMGNIEVLSMMDKFLDNLNTDDCHVNYCDFIFEQLNLFLNGQKTETSTEPSSKKSNQPSVIMIDDLSILLTIGCSPRDVTRLILKTDALMRTKSLNPLVTRLSHLVVQTTFTNIKEKQEQLPEDMELNFIIKNLENICDVHIALKPLDTGHSTRVDGTITFIDNRLPTKGVASADIRTSMLTNILSSSSADIGLRRAYFFKLSDRRVRLTSSAFIF